MRTALAVAVLFSTAALADTPRNPPARDPFQGPNAGRRTVRECKKGSCRFGLDELKVVAVVMDNNGDRLAMLEDPEGTGYVIRPGTTIGRERAKVRTITREAIELVIPDGERVVTIAIPQGAPALPDLLDLSKPEEQN